MYYEEKVINGVLHWRNMPDAEFIPFTAEELTIRLVKQKESYGCGTPPDVLESEILDIK